MKAEVVLRGQTCQGFSADVAGNWNMSHFSLDRWSINASDEAVAPPPVLLTAALAVFRAALPLSPREFPLKRRSECQFDLLCIGGSPDPVHAHSAVATLL